MKKFLMGFKYAFNGIIKALSSELNMKVHFISMLLVIILGFILKINMYEWIACIILFGLVISSEIINTAIETVIDLVSPDYNKQAGLAKDLAAGAVLVNAIVAAIVAAIIFLPKIFNI